MGENRNIIIFLYDATFCNAVASNSQKRKRGGQNLRQNIEALAERILLDEYERFYRLAFSYVNNEQDALDIVQESACKVIRDCRDIREPEFLSTWIYRIVMNTAVDFLRKRQKEQVGLDEIVIPHEDRYRESDPMELLKSLEEGERTVVILRYFEELKLEEIARVLDCNVNTVKARLYRALKKLRIELEPARLDYL